MSGTGGSVSSAKELVCHWMAHLLSLSLKLVSSEFSPEMKVHLFFLLSFNSLYVETMSQGSISEWCKKLKTLTCWGSQIMVEAPLCVLDLMVLKAWPYSI